MHLLGKANSSATAALPAPFVVHQNKMFGENESQVSGFFKRKHVCNHLIY